MGRLLHAISRDLRAHEQSKPGSAVEVPTASSRDGLKEKHGHTAAYHWPGLSASTRVKQARPREVEVPTASSRDGLKEKHGQTAAYHWPGLSVSTRAKQDWFSGSGSHCVFS